MEIKGDIVVKRTGVFERRADQGLSSNNSIGTGITLTRNSARWQDLGEAGQNTTVTMPDATTLPKGWEIVINNTAPGGVTAFSAQLPTTSGNYSANPGPYTYTGISVAGGAGSLCTVDVDINGSNNVSSITINVAGSGYITGDILTIDGGNIGGTTGVDNLTIIVTDTDNAYEMTVYNGDPVTPTLLQAIPKPTNPNLGAYVFSLLDNSSAAGRWYVTSLENSGEAPASRYTKDHDASGDWTGPSFDEYYTISVPSATHGRGLKPSVQFFEYSGILYGTNASNSLTNGESFSTPSITGTVVKNLCIVTGTNTGNLTPGESVTIAGAVPGTAVVVSCTSTILVLKNFTTPGANSDTFTGATSTFVFTASSTPTQVLYITGQSAIITSGLTLTGGTSAYTFTTTEDQAFDQVTPDTFSVATNGGVNFSVPSDPDLRYPGRAIFI